MSSGHGEKKMTGQVSELLEIAMNREIVSQAFYIAGQKQVADPGSRELMAELAADECKHLEMIKALKEKGLTAKEWVPEYVPNLMISEYLVDTPLSEGATIQDVLTLAMKREQQSVEFYSKMMSVMKRKTTKLLCEKLVHAELKHKMKLEMFYDDMFYKEN
jgi:rubrerythrin